MPAPRDGEPEARPPADLLELQRFLAGALRRDAPTPDDNPIAETARALVAGNDRVTPAEQVDIYRNQFWLRHIESLTEDYPGLRALVGEDAFDAFARAYLHAHPPRVPSLRDLGADIVAFAQSWAGFPSERRAAALEMITYEHAFIDLFDGPEPPPLDAHKLAALPPDAWETARIVIHPLLARMRVEYPVHRYRLDALDAGAAEPPPFPAPSPTNLVLYRSELVVRYDELEPAAFSLLDALAAGEPLVPACDRVAASLDPAAADALGAKVGPWFQDWTARRWIVDVLL